LTAKFFTLKENPRPPQRHASRTQTVETVEKVSFQKYFLKSGTETLKSIWFLVFCTTFWLFFSLLWEVFLNIFRTMGFSTVSFGGCRKETVKKTMAIKEPQPCEHW
jgi:hypothetical protein